MAGGAVGVGDVQRARESKNYVACTFLPSAPSIGFTFLVPAHLCSPGRGPLNGCVCVCVCVPQLPPSIKTLHTRTHTHPFNGHLSGTTQVSRHQKGKTNLDFTEATDSEWQWHQLGHMQVCILLQTLNHASTPPLSFYRPDALRAAQPTASKH